MDGRSIRSSAIREEYQANPLRTSRPIPLLPAERDHVLLLLPRELLKVNPASNRMPAAPVRGEHRPGNIHRFD